MKSSLTMKHSIFQFAIIFYSRRKCIYAFSFHSVKHFH